MIIEIKDDKSIGEICREFSAAYPFLKIEFFDSPHFWQQASALKQMIPHDRKIKEIRKLHKAGVMHIHALNKTGTIEQEFYRSFGLNVQIFRKHGDDWIQTAGTDELLLEEQNELGKKASEAMLHGSDRKFENEKPL